MERFVAIEGIDGSGKKTQTALLAAHAREHGLSVVCFSFPRYGKSLFAGSVAEYLNGEYGDLTATPPEFAALLFAGDRLEARDELIGAMKEFDLVICDRYVASNVAHQSSRLPEPRRGRFQEWITAIEFTIYSLPKPEATVYLDLPADVAHRAISGKSQRVYTERTRDLHEADLDHLRTCRDTYRELHRAPWCGRWIEVACAEGGELRPPESIADDVWKRLAQA